MDTNFLENFYFRKRFFLDKGIFGLIREGDYLVLLAHFGGVRPVNPVPDLGEELVALLDGVVARVARSVADKEPQGPRNTIKPRRLQNISAKFIFLFSLGLASREFYWFEIFSCFVRSHFKVACLGAEEGVGVRVLAVALCKKETQWPIDHLPKKTIIN